MGPGPRPKHGGMRAAPALFMAALAGLGFLAYRQTADTLEARGVRTGFGFLDQEAGFAIGEALPLPALGGPGASFATGAIVLAALALVVRLVVPSLQTGPGRRLTWLLSCASLAVVVGLLAAGSASLRFVDYGPHQPLAMALATGFANTVMVSVAAILLASVLGLVIGLGRLSHNWLVRSAAGLYVETFRNLPLLILVFFWYFGVLRALPPMRSSIDLWGIAALNNRGVFLPRPEAGPGFAAFVAALAVGFIVWRWARYGLARRRPDARWRTLAVPTALAAFVVLATVAWLAFGPAVGWSYPVRAGFNFRGGFSISPEFAALLLGLTTYAAAFIAEIVRSGVQGVRRGQWEAARALGLSERRILGLVVLPQSLRIIVPPLISQYLSLVKDSSLGFAIAFPELVSITNTAINHTGQPIEILAITICVFLLLNLLISAAIAGYHRSRPWLPT
jgi:general L-amino acid transport system permease protein